MKWYLPVLLSTFIGWTAVAEDANPASAPNAPDPNARFAKDIAKLVADHRDAYDAAWGWFQYFDGRIAVVGDDPLRGTIYYGFTAGDLRLRELTIPGIEHLRSVGTSQQRPVAVGTTNGRGVLCEKIDGRWRKVAVPEGLAGVEYPRLIPSTDGIAIEAKERLYRLEGGRWRETITEPPVPKFALEINPHALMLRQYVYHAKLFAVWELMEFGGMVTILDLQNPQTGWQEVNVTGHPRLPDPPGGNYVTARGGPWVTGITADAAGHLWVSESVEDDWRGLYEYDGDHWTTVVHKTFWQPSEGVTDFPGEKTEIKDVCLAPDHKVYVLGDEAGIFVVEKHRLTPVLPFNFTHISQPMKINGFDSALVCRPQSLVVDEHGDLFVSTQGYGVLCFLKTAVGYRLRQVAYPPFLFGPQGTTPAS